MKIEVTVYGKFDIVGERPIGKIIFDTEKDLPAENKIKFDLGPVKVRGRIKAVKKV